MSNITVTTAATSRRLTTVPNVQAALDETGEETLFAQLIDRASAEVEKFCNQTFAQERVVELLGARGETILMLTRTPIVTVHEIKLDGDVVEASNYKVHDADAGTLFNSGGWTSTQMMRQGLTRWPEHVQDRLWSVDYTAGFLVPAAAGGSPAPNLPYDIEDATIETVKAMWKGKGRDPSVTSRRLGDWAESYGGGKQGSSISGRIPDSAKSLLLPWQRSA